MARPVNSTQPQFVPRAFVATLIKIKALAGRKLIQFSDPYAFSVRYTWIFSTVFLEFVKWSVKQSHLHQLQPVTCLISEYSSCQITSGDLAFLFLHHQNRNKRTGQPENYFLSKVSKNTTRPLMIYWVPSWVFFSFSSMILLLVRALLASLWLFENLCKYFKPKS